MKPLFVDTGAWYALANRLDAHHADAQAVLGGNRRPLLTTNYVAVETTNLLNARAGHRAAELLLDGLRASQLVTVHHINPREHAQTEAYFRRHRDKGWSLTDCSSFVVMGALGLGEAFTFDRHFTQAGFSRVP